MNATLESDEATTETLNSGEGFRPSRVTASDVVNAFALLHEVVVARGLSPANPALRDSIHAGVSGLRSGDHERAIAVTLEGVKTALRLPPGEFIWQDVRRKPKAGEALVG